MTVKTGKLTWAELMAIEEGQSQGFSEANLKKMQELWDDLDWSTVPENVAFPEGWSDLEANEKAARARAAGSQSEMSPRANHSKGNAKQW